MRSSVALPVVVGLCVLLLWGAALSQPTGVDAAQTAHRMIAAQAARVSLAPDLLEQLQQGGGPKIDYTPQEPLDLLVPLPDDAQVYAALKQGVEYILAQQKENGSFDVVLRGDMLSRTADEALDAVAVTSLCGLAILLHKDIDPVRIQQAADKATDFVIDRIARGRLSETIIYAVWRYTFGLKFMTVAYHECSNPERKMEIRYIVRRMIQSLMNIQLTQGEPPRLEDRREADMDLEVGELAQQAASLNIVVSERDGQQGVWITEVFADGNGHRAGLRVGDRLLMVEDVKLKYSYEFFEMDTQFVGGQVVNLQIERDGRVIDLKTTLVSSWPGNIGVEWKWEKGFGPVVTAFSPYSTARTAGIEVGDLIAAVNGVKVTDEQAFNDSLSGISVGGHVDVTFFRHANEDLLTVDVVASPGPAGTLGCELKMEDKTDIGGVIVGQVQPNSAASRASLRTNDRITHIDGVPVQGIDHYNLLMKTLWGGKEVILTVLRREGPQKVTATLDAFRPRGLLGVTFANDATGKAAIGVVRKDSPAERAGIQVGDVITHINGAKTPNQQSVMDKFVNFKAGDTITITLLRGDEKIDVEVELAERSERTIVREEGGWNYYHMGMATSFTTSATLIALLEARDTFEIDIPQQCLEAAFNLVESLRVTDPAHDNVESYVYHRDAKAQPVGVDVRGHMGRILACEYALVTATDHGVPQPEQVRNIKHLEIALQLWMDHRDELDRVRSFKHTHHQQLFLNAAYYWMYGHYHTMLAANYIADEALKMRVANTVLKAMMAVRQEDGTWLGHSAFGPLSGTAEALMVWGELKPYMVHLNEPRHGELTAAVQALRAGNYAEGYAMVAGVASRGGDAGAEAAALQQQLDISIARRIDEAKLMWIYDPPRGIEHGEALLKSYTPLTSGEGVPAVKEFSAQFAGWKEDKETLARFNDLAVRLQDTLDGIKQGGPLMPEVDGLAFAKQLEDISREAGADTRIGKSAFQEKQDLESSYKAPPYIGIAPNPNHQGDGVMLAQVIEGQAADLAGLKAGDIILKVNGVALRGVQALGQELNKFKVGEDVTILVKHRNGKEEEMILTMGRRTTD